MRAVQELIEQATQPLDILTLQRLFERASQEETDPDILVLVEGALATLKAGQPPLEEIELLVHLLPQAPPEEAIENHIRALAAALWEADWHTGMVRELTAVLESGQFADYRQALSARLDRATAGYEATMTSLGELSAEAWVGRKLFLEAIGCLRTSLEQIEQDSAAALKSSEEGNRLLTAVQRHTDRNQAGWVKVREGIIPPSPVIGGLDSAGIVLCVAAATIDGQLMPGRTRPPFSQALIGHRGRTRFSTDFTMLSDASASWVVPNAKTLSQAIGVDAERTWLVARGFHEGQWIPGKARVEGGCLIPFGQEELPCEVYQILVSAVALNV